MKAMSLPTVSNLIYCWILVSFVYFVVLVQASDSQKIDKNILCDLPSLGPSGYMSDEGLIFHWNLCPQNKIKLTDLNPKCANEKDGTNTNDKTGDVCITKVNRTSKTIDRYLVNAGVLEGAYIVSEGTGHFSLLLDHGEKCGDSQTNHSTRFDFFCNDGEPEKDPQQSILLTKFSQQCNFSLFWYTSLACSPEKQAIKPKGNFVVVL